MRSLVLITFLISASCADPVADFVVQDSGVDTESDESDSSTSTESDNSTDADTSSSTSTDTETTTDSGTESGTDTETDSETNAGTDTATATESETSTETEIDTDTDTGAYGKIARISGKVVLASYLEDEVEDDSWLASGCFRVEIAKTRPTDYVPYNIEDEIVGITDYGLSPLDGKNFTFQIDRDTEPPGTYYVRAYFDGYNECSGVYKNMFYAVDDGCPSFELTGKTYSGLEIVLNQHWPRTP